MGLYISLEDLHLLVYEAHDHLILLSCKSHLIEFDGYNKVLSICDPIFQNGFYLLQLRSTKPYLQFHVEQRSLCFCHGISFVAVVQIVFIPLHLVVPGVIC